jgi:hypothetical protein
VTADNVADLPTPALVVDVAALDRNIDAQYDRQGHRFSQAVFVVSSAPQWSVANAGLKAFGMDHGNYRLVAASSGSRVRPDTSLASITSPCTIASPPRSSRAEDPGCAEDPVADRPPTVPDSPEFPGFSAADRPTTRSGTTRHAGGTEGASWPSPRCGRRCPPAATDRPRPGSGTGRRPCRPDAGLPRTALPVLGDEVVDCWPIDLRGW